VESPVEVSQEAAFRVAAFRVAAFRVVVFRVVVFRVAGPCLLGNLDRRRPTLPTDRRFDCVHSHRPRQMAAGACVVWKDLVRRN
jgi:hypothetical protein